MSEHLPPIDSDIRKQLARRSAGRLPDGLLGDVFAALDGVAAPRAGLPWRRLTWSLPRLAGTALGVALVVVLAVAVAFPALHNGPAASSGNYPADRALTTSELASVLAGPQLAPTTTLVASVTIDGPGNACSVNGILPVGVIHGIEPHVCVVGAYGSSLAGPTGQGTFAFRYQSPGYLGLIGEIAPAASRLAFQVTDEWPLDGRTFLVDGWLGAEELTVSCAVAPTVVNVLAPNGEDCPYDDWLGDAPTAPGIQADHEFYAPGPVPSYDPLSLRGNARHVEAGGMRHLDSIDPGTPAHGVYVVREVTQECPNASPQDSRGCSFWLVLAKVDVSVSSASPAPVLPAATTTPPATGIANLAPSFGLAPAGLIGPNDRAMTAAELSALAAADPNHLAGRYVIDERVTCDGTDCSGSPPKAVADTIQADGTIGLAGPVDVRPDGGLVWTVPQALADYQGRFILIVDGWMTGSGNDTWLGSGPSATELTAQSGAFNQFAPAGTPEGTGVRGLFLVLRVDNGKTCGSGPPASAGVCSAQVEIFARLEPAVLP